MLRTQIYLPRRQIKFLKKKAFEEDTTLSGTLRKLVDQAVKKSQKPAVGRNAGDWLLSLADQARKLKIKGPADLAEDLDQYLYGGKK